MGRHWYMDSELSLILLLLIGFAFHMQWPAVEGRSVSFAFSSFPPGVANLSVNGDAQPTSKGSLQLTDNEKESNLQRSVGRAFYSKPIRLLDPSTNATASFATSFTFRIHNVTAKNLGDGLAFVLFPNMSPASPKAAGGYLGIFEPPENNNTAGSSSNHTLGIEFDTFQNSFDPDSNHVGIDINSIVSKRTASLDLVGVDLKSDNNITAWIDYDANLKLLDIYVSHNAVKPQESPLLSYRIDLATVISEYMYVGFSAATGYCFELHSILSWEFNSSDIIPQPTVSAPSPNGGASNIVAQHSGNQHGTTAARSYKLGLLVGLSLTALLSALSATAVYGYEQWKRGLWKSKALRLLEHADQYAYGPRHFCRQELISATNNFSPKQLLGQGGFGRVYKGVMTEDGSLVAVKRVSEDSQQGEKEFAAEVTTIGRLRHRNLVQLQGWCHDEGELLLVYEFMPNGSLDKALFENEETLNWKQRHNIICGLAAALLYLHEEWDQQVLHRDVKPSNVMLDAGFNARLGDFGLARLIEHNQNPETTIVAGTLGYLAPEASQTGKPTTKSDVFSFGIVALEVACGRRPIDRSREPSEVVLVDWVWELRTQGRLLEAADPRLGGEFDHQEMTGLLHLGLACSHPDASARPTIRAVVQCLTAHSPLPTLPSKRPVAFYPSSPPQLNCLHSHTCSIPTSSMESSDVFHCPDAKP
ncbi:hypothetical protein O6H91_04G052400 [Diphasiastrum complanatum]|uniref:Uncharacterized protein n=3 Tax=Diphasiastrum complanatum TaxID=34168 RepID=A0ACC2DWW0_DIPCM|nr:hypothetical protein O6H91_10G043800 [Diphasiastrum complanatum]KAJ7558716.1 hypothetical protein O6H91_04G052400 [Diphasiastrum complanatum]KAJ7558717.1 hypothetical protein O6H91_04G052400 [Diphasiastrum complanatum]